MARGVSTVLDVAVCLLLIGAALATLAATPPAATNEAPTADGTAATIATATTGVPVGQDTRHATLAAHLGTAAVIAATVDDRQLLRTTYPRAVENTTADVVPRRVYVTARWVPFPNASVGGRVTAGIEPPATAEVAAATLTVDNGVDGPRIGDGPTFASLADAIAEAVVEWLFPPRRTRAAQLAPGTDPSVDARYRAVGTTLGVEVEPLVAETNVSGANDALATALAARFEADIRAEYRTPGAAADAVSVNTTTVVVRRWEAKP